MIPFNLQLEINAQLLTISVEQLNQLADSVSFMRYQIRSTDHNAVILVNIEEDQHPHDEVIGLSEDDTFTQDEIKVIAAAIRQHNNRGKYTFDQMTFDF